MRKFHLLLAIITGLFFAGCSSSKPTGVWVNKEKIQGKSFKNLFIVVVSADVEARSMIENDLAAAAESKGYKAVKSYEVMNTSLRDPKKPTKEEVVSKVKESGCDAVFIASLLRKEEDVHYVPSKDSYSVMPYYSYYGTYTGYYSNVYNTVHRPAYYDHEQTYFVQSNLYDAASEEIMWSVQSELFKPASLQIFSKAYTYALLKQLESEKLLKKK